jgi:uridine phosphorylase
MGGMNWFAVRKYKWYSFHLDYRRLVSWWNNTILRKPQYHIGLRFGEIPPDVVLVETPRQARQIAECLGNYHEMEDHREYLSIRIQTEKNSLLVISSGIGTPPIAIGLEELSLIGGERFLYLGSYTSLQKVSKEEQLLIVKGAVKEDGTSQEYLPQIIPAVADIHLLNAARRALTDAHLSYRIGISATIDIDPSHYPPPTPMQAPIEKHVRQLKEGNTLAIERAAAGVYAVAAKIHKPAVCILQNGEPGLPFSEKLIRVIPQMFPH